MEMAPHEEEQDILKIDLGAEVGGRQQVLSDGTHHPEGILLLRNSRRQAATSAERGTWGSYPNIPMNQKRGSQVAGVGSILYLMGSNPGEGRVSLGLDWKESYSWDRSKPPTASQNGHQSTVASNKVFWGGVGI